MRYFNISDTLLDAVADIDDILEDDLETGRYDAIIRKRIIAVRNVMDALRFELDCPPDENIREIFKRETEKMEAEGVKARVINDISFDVPMRISYVSHDNLPHWIWERVEE